MPELGSSIKVGFILCTSRKDGSLYVYLLGVMPEYRRLGYASQLLQSAKDYAHRHGFPALSLHANVENLKALRLYRKFGFRPVIRIPDYYRGSMEYTNKDGYYMKVNVRPREVM